MVASGQNPAPIERVLEAMTTRSQTAAAIALALLLGGCEPSASADASRATGDGARGGFLRGMTVSCPREGRIWGSPWMAETLAELGGLGVEWVAIHPYAGVRRDGTVRWRPAAETGYLDRAVAHAREAGIALFLKPHLAYWGSFAWRGEIGFGDDRDAWDRFFAGYRAFIVDQARFAERSGITLFAVGLEYKQTTWREAEWRRIIADVRRVYSGRITYSANWDHVEHVPFWDAVDLIGVQGYFPLSHDPDPSAETLRRGWDAPLAQLRRLSERHGKPVLFAEIGYDVAEGAAREPWQRRTRDTARNRALQRRLIEVALERLEAEPFVEGMFWWKWLPHRDRVADFAMQHENAKEVLRRTWGS